MLLVLKIKSFPILADGAGVTGPRRTLAGSRFVTLTGPERLEPLFRTLIV